MVTKTVLNNSINNTMNTCPCCSQRMLRHARHGQIYWFCAHCHQEMPNLSSALIGATQGSSRRSPLLHLRSVQETLDIAH